MRVSARDGADLTPRGAKQRGVLALLATGRDCRRTRAVVMDRLWSDRAPEQAAASLRQALHALRAEFGTQALVSGQGWIGLNTECITVHLDPLIWPVDGSLPEFAEGLDIPDPEFEDWIREARAHFAARWAQARPDPAATGTPANGGATAGPLRQPAPQAPDTERGEPDTPIHLLLPPIAEAAGTADLLSDMVLRDAAQRAAHMVGAEVREPGNRTPSEPRPHGSLSMTCRVAEFPERIILQPSLKDPASGCLLWSQTFTGNPAELQDLIAAAVSAVSRAVITHVATARETSQRVPLFDAFSFDAARLLSADATLQADNPSLASGPVRLAYRAWLRHTLVMERLTQSPGDALGEAYEMVRHARDAAPFNQFVLAVDSLICGARGNDELSLEIALEARRIDPNHAFVRKALSVAYSFNGMPREAHQEAIAAQTNGMSMLAPGFFDLRKAYTAIGMGDQAGALRWALSAIQRSPDLRAAHRVVAALQYADGNIEAAEASLRTLKALEPDFSLDLMASDSYPVDSLRKAGLLEVARSGLL